MSADDFKEWKLDIQVLDDNPIYRNQTYRLQFRFSNNYPIGTSSPTFPTPLQPKASHTFSALLTCHIPTEAPEVTFQRTPDRPIPIHPHIYSNGIICLDLLGSQGWSPVQNVESVCMSIQSMLTGNTKSERPPGDEDFVRRNTQRPRDIRFFYDDNTV